MPPCLHCITPLALAGLIAAGPVGADTGDGKHVVQDYAGEPYTGFIDVRIDPPGGKAWTQYGRGSAHLTDIGDGRARLVVFGAIDDDRGDAGFAVEGRYDDDGWVSRTDNVNLRIDTTGTIVGEGTVPPQHYAFSGAVTASTFDLVVDLELTEATENGLPAGTRFHFTYDLYRGVPNADEGEDLSRNADESAPRKDGKCRKIRYEMRPVASIGDGTMSMIQVPICIQ